MERGGGHARIGDSAALGDDAFAALMLGFAPFEPKPVLAVAVSGGPDSLALCLLAARWARARGGRVLALTVDHRLRPESAAEARQVARWMKKRGIAHRVLVWSEPKPAANRAAAARAARYRLLAAEAARRGILHLLLAHHRDDQAETLLLRLGRGSGVDGLSAMAACVELTGLRLLRPLLGVPKARLIATLRALRQDWIEDPSNLAPGYARSRLRKSLAAFADAGLTARRLAETAGRIGRARAALEDAAAALAARAAHVHPAGFVRLDPGALAAAPEEIRLRVLAHCLMAVAGAEYPPRLERLEDLARALTGPGFRGRTLHGCRIVPEGRALLVCREPAAVSGRTALEPGGWTAWDGRFLVRARPGRSLSVAALGQAGLGAVGADLRKPGIPRLAALTLPGIWAGNRLVSAPFPGWPGGKPCAEVDGRKPGQAGRILKFSAVFAPPAPVAPPGFAAGSAIASAPPHPI
jgi:tRNA(Ile)-lysidine synthase